MCVCVYVCMCVCVYGCTGVWVYGCMVYGCMGVCMYHAGLFVRTHVCISAPTGLVFINRRSFAFPSIRNLASLRVYGFINVCMCVCVYGCMGVWVYGLG